MKNQWLEIDKEGLRKTLGQKDKVFLLTEMVSNAWDEDITEVEVYGTEKFRSDNLYQIYAYLRTQEQHGASYRNASGMLLYPTTGRSLNESMLVQGHRIRVVTLDLCQPWERIESDIVALVTSAMSGGA